MLSVKRPSVKNLLGCLFFGSLFISGSQSADAAHEDRQSFRDFRLQNAGIDRHTARHIYKDLHGRPGGDWKNVSTSAPHERLQIQPINQQFNPAVLRNIEHKSFNPSLQFNDRGRLVRLESGINLDLNSQDKNIILGQKLFANVGSIDIQVGGETKTLAAGDRVSAAEYVAVKQVLNGQGQSLTLNGSGQATSGAVDLSALTRKNDVMRARSLVVPVSVTALGDFTKGSDFRLLGDLNNFGIVEITDSNGGTRGGAVRADNINNHSDALISSSVDLTLLANGNLTNQGTINSSEGLTLQARQLNNSGNIIAGTHINLSANSLKNSGNVVSHGGDISIAALPGNTEALTIDNTNGMLSALNGAVNINGPSGIGQYDVTVNGGNVFCSELNLNAGNGTINVNVDELTGAVNSSGSAVHVAADTDVLTIGKTCLTGDPTYFNTAGSIAIVGNITVAEALTIVAFGDINVNNGSDLVAANATQGFPITLIAGANVSNVGGANQPNLGPIPPVNPQNGSVTINGGSITGGSISFNSSAGIDTFISTRPTGATGNGADVQLVAFAGSNASSGRVNTGLPTFDRIFTGGKTTGNNGDITIIAPGLNNGATFLPELDSSGGTGVAGNISAIAANPIANSVTYNALGTLTSAPITANAAITNNGEVRFVKVNAGRGSVTAAGNLVQVSGNTTMTARRIDFSGGAISVFGNVTASSLFTANAFGTVLSEFGAIEGQVTSPVSILSTTGGTIGVAGQEFKVTGGTVFADGVNGVNIVSTGGISIAGGSTNFGNFVVGANGNTSITGDIRVNTGNVLISTTAGSFTAGAVNVSTNSGDILLANLGVDKKNSKLVLTGTNVSALGGPGNGDVTISVGTLGAPVSGKAPKKNIGVTLNGGFMFFGAKGITTLAPTNSLTANNGATLLFNNPLNKKLILLTGATLVAN